MDEIRYIASDNEMQAGCLCADNLNVILEIRASEM